jgi:hypothetical protein
VLHTKHQPDSQTVLSVVNWELKLEKADAMVYYNQMNNFALKHDKKVITMV